MEKIERVLTGITEGISLLLSFTVSKIVSVRRRLWKIRWTFWREKTTSERLLPKRPRQPTCFGRRKEENQDVGEEITTSRRDLVSQVGGGTKTDLKIAVEKMPHNYIPPTYERPPLLSIELS